MNTQRERDRQREREFSLFSFVYESLKILLMNDNEKWHCQNLQEQLRVMLKETSKLSRHIQV
jgi:hypothetical protein